MAIYNRNGATVTITPTTSWTGEEVQLSNVQVSNDFDNRSDKLSFSGSARVGMPIKIATVLIVADTDMYFSTPPYLKSGSRNIKLQFKDKVVYRGTTSRLKTAHGKYHTSYTFDLIFTPLKKTFSTKKMDVRLRYLTKTIPTVITEISSITLGKRDNILSLNGESRRICIYGTKDAEFGLTVSERYAEEITNVDGTKENFYQKTREVSILEQGDFVPLDNGVMMKVLRGRIPTSGKYEFIQKFPSIVSKETHLGVAASSTNRLELRDVRNIRVGDRLFYGQASTSVIKVTHIDPDNDKPHEIQIDTTISLEKGKPIIFKRNKSYQLAFVEKYTSSINDQLLIKNLGNDIATKDDGSAVFRPKAYNFYQLQPAKLTIQHFISGSNITITHYNGVATGLDRGDEHEIIKYGENIHVNTPKTSSNREFSVSIILDLHDAAQTFTGVTIPVFNSAPRRPLNQNENPAASNWTNSMSRINGGTQLNIKRVKWSATGQNTITLSYDVEVVRFGVKDVTMVLDLDAITTIA